ncbi:hypothetical protein WJX81_007928 [Elliptochloris bilobata]|uniref:RBR-type E3 ubiquitin transferase n=1 Tax=Elliptochloris bilobata TaxID=381761 RepID=A0AAW1REN4_9CHLO
MDIDSCSSDAYGYSGDEGASGSSEDGDYGFDPHAEVETSTRQAPYVVFSEEQLRERQEEAISAVTSVLSISRGEAVRVLRQCKWDVNRVNEEWFTDMDAVRQKVGILEEQPVASTSGKETCQICFDEVQAREMRSARCGHLFCRDCWRGYVANAINSGPSALNLRCPLPECTAAVPTAVVEAVASPADLRRFRQYALRSYVEDNRKLTWCPAPGCEHAVEALVDLGAEPLDIACVCGAAFCFQCKEEAHRPVDCETVSKWIGSWAEHGERTGGFYACNRYEAAKKKGDYDEETQRREHAKNALERYMHYYQRWAENDRARLKALSTMKDFQEKMLEKLSEMTMTPTSQLRFLLDAWLQVVDCRRILKWTYAYGYYRFSEQAATGVAAVPRDVLRQRQEFFEFNQGNAELYLEKLHGMAEKEPNAFAEGEAPIASWPKFRENLIGLTDVTRSHFEKLVQELEKGLDNLLADYGAEGGAEGGEPPGAGPSGSQGVPTKARAARGGRAPKRSRAVKGGAAAAAAAGGDSDMEVEAGFWQCAACTFANRDLRAMRCDACDTPRPRRSER